MSSSPPPTPTTPINRTSTLTSSCPPPPPPAKSKYIQLVETLFSTASRGGDATSCDAQFADDAFWDEFFLLRVNVAFVARELFHADDRRLDAIRPAIQLLFRRSNARLRCDRDESPLRICNAIETLCCLVAGLARKRSLQGSAYDLLETLCGFERAEEELRALIDAIVELLLRDDAKELRYRALALLSTLVFVFDSPNSNAFIEFLMMSSKLFDALILMLGDGERSSEVLLLLSTLLQYRKSADRNPYAMKLSIMDQDVQLDALAQAIGRALRAAVDDFLRRSLGTADSRSFISSIANAFGSFFTSPVAPSPSQVDQSVCFQRHEPALLALLHAAQLNRVFGTTLTTSFRLSSSSSTAPDHGDDDAKPPITPPPTSNVCLLANFLEYFSLVMQSPWPRAKNAQAAALNTQLCFRALEIFVDDQFALSAVHDSMLAYRVRLFRAPMRHRSRSNNNNGASPNTPDSLDADSTVARRPLVYAIFNLMHEYIASHLIKSALFPYDSYHRALSILHRLIVYEKRQRIRLQYDWPQLWEALSALARFLVANEQLLAAHFDVFALSDRIVQLFNLFITCGDHFLPDSNCYDRLYYEITRQHHIFERLYAACLRRATAAGDDDVSSTQRASAKRLLNHLCNVRGIINHCNPRVEAYMAERRQTSPSVEPLTEHDVLEIVRASYSSLTLRILDSLEQSEAAAPSVHDATVVKAATRRAIADAKRPPTALSACLLAAQNESVASDALYEEAVRAMARASMRTASLGSQEQKSSPPSGNGVAS